MSDIARHLPLSQRDSSGEVAATNDWRPLTIQCLSMITDLLQNLTAEQWEQQSGRPGWLIRDAVGGLAWQLSNGRLALARDAAATVVRGGVTRRRFDRLQKMRRSNQTDGELVATFLRIADARLPHRSERGIRRLTDVVVCGYDIAYPLGTTLPFPPLATGAIAVARSLTAPTRVTAVLGNRTFRAVDAGWSVGRGPEVVATAEDIIRFLFGRAGPRSSRPIDGSN